MRQDNNNNLPQRQHHDDAGCDLRVARSEIIRSHQTITVSTGYHPQEGDIPPHSVGLVFARSSLHKRGLSLANGVGVIDSGYEGEVLLALRNDMDESVGVRRGERLAQIVVIPLDLSSTLYAAQYCDNNNDNDDNNTRPRGSSGFGSTGRN